ncbi:hypothetical protein [Ulvibacterium sp.]|uniref:hypothetical protein n=1 Tax=Ulvibacterium sp. TaxID=2665914 RepID=UPI002601AA5F|nr:hypothetical protein [Ulvibacterium sp.]
MSSGLSIRSSHVYFTAELAKKVFQQVHYAYVTYAKEQGHLLITPVSSQWFVKMYEPTQFLLKERNLKGDKTLALREIFIDNELDSTDRNLEYEWIEKTNLIKVAM